MILAFALLVGLVVLFSIIVLGAAEASCKPEDDPTLYGGTFDGPGTLGGVMGTGISSAEITAARKHTFGGTSIAPSSKYVSTAYAPSAGGINCGNGCGSTASGIKVDGGKRRVYIIASNPRMNKYGAFAYIWPNPYGWRGPFVVADTGGNFDGSDGSHRIDFYTWGDSSKANEWGRRGDIRVSSEPIVSGGPGDSNTDTPIVALARVASRTPQGADSARMVRPTSGPFTSPFGERWGRLHAGVDIAPAAGTPIVAVLAGTVVFKGLMGGYGNFTCIRHAPKLTTCYAHQQRFAASVRTGASVSQGQTIGFVGNTGRSTGPHLHFEVRLGPDFSGAPTDPMPYLQGAVEVTPTDGGAGSAQCATTLATATAGSYAWPVAGKRAGSDVIGQPGQGTHSFTAAPNNWQSDNAIDIATRFGTPLAAVDDGTISTSLGFGETSSDESSRFGGMRFHLVDSHNNIWYYAHLSRITVRPGQRITKGQPVGFSGTANGVGHLHIASRDGSPAALLGVTR